MEISNFSTVNSNLSNYKAPFKGEGNNPVSNPINEEIKPEIVDKNYADATKSLAMAQILVGNDFKPNMTQEEYVNSLIKKGKVQNKDFFIEEYPLNSYGKSSTWIKELNPKGQRTKETIFWSEPEGRGTEIRLYDPNTQEVYKAIGIQNGKVNVTYNDTPFINEFYKKNAELEQSAIYTLDEIYRNREKSETPSSDDISSHK